MARLAGAHKWFLTHAVYCSLDSCAPSAMKFSEIVIGRLYHHYPDGRWEDRCGPIIKSHPCVPLIPDRNYEAFYCYLITSKPIPGLGPVRQLKPEPPHNDVSLFDLGPNSFLALEREDSTNLHKKGHSDDCYLQYANLKLIPVEQIDGLKGGMSWNYAPPIKTVFIDYIAYARLWKLGTKYARRVKGEAEHGKIIDGKPCYGARQDWPTGHTRIAEAEYIEYRLKNSPGWNSHHVALTAIAVDEDAGTESW